ncbi:MAG: LuxR C-terminal-related transcriptional regulator [Actinomycetota bacterium]
MEPLAKAREAVAAYDWPTAYEILSNTRPEDSLGGDDLDGLADAAWWLGHLDESIAARQQAFESYTSSGNTERAALAALSVSLHLGDKGDEALAAGWRARAHRLAAEVPDSLAKGLLISLDADAAFHAGDVAGCLTMAGETIEIGNRLSDDTLVAWGTHLEGLGLVKQGHVAEGWARLEESMVAVSTKNLRPVWAGLMHCGMLLACELVDDPRRGWQWVEATEEWLKTFPRAVLYRGVCRIHKVRFMQLRGVWLGAEAEARRACEELERVHVYTAARGYYEIAEIKRLMGDLEAAHDYYRRAHALGWDPQPGLARLRLAQGRMEAAVAGIRRALDEARDRPARAALLPHQIDIALAAGDLPTAEEAAEELSVIASDYQSPGMTAGAASGKGTVLLAKGDPKAALMELRKAIAAWLELDCPYELARSRLLSATAHRELGDEDGAAMELEAARETFVRLGATPAAQRAAELLGGSEHPGGLSARELEVLRLVAAGKSNKEIAKELFISENTVARHMSHILAKLDVPSRAAATTFALKHNLV